MQHDFQLGDRVRLSLEAFRSGVGIDPAIASRLGTIAKKPRGRSETVSVLWDGLTRASSYAKRYLDRVT